MTVEKIEKKPLLQKLSLFKNLKELIIDKVNIEELPDSINVCQNLQLLKFNDTNLMEIDSYIGDL